MVSGISALIKIRHSDIRAFEKLFRQYYEPLCLYAASFTHNTESAEEIVQELFYTIWKERENLHIFLSVKSYLYKAVRNNALQHLRHLKVRENYQTLAEKEQDEEKLCNNPLDELEYLELQEQIAKVLASLPERRRQIFEMHRFEGKKYTEIAETFSISIKTVEAEMSKALQTFKQMIGNQRT